jgi:hypothetical protein
MKTFTFICGCGHTGSSLLASMFAAHPDVYVPLRETETFLDDTNAASSWASLLGEAEASGKAHFVEKTPRHIYKLDLMRSLVPESRMILTVRDGRDVAASFIKRFGSAEVGVERWLTESALVRDALQGKDTTLIRYEDLLARPASELERLSKFAGIPFSASMLAYHEHPRLWFGVEEMHKGTGAAGEQHRLLRNWQINQPLFDARGIWRRELPPESVRSFEQGAGRELMQFFGYDG